MKKYLGWLSVLVVIFFALPFLPIYGTVQAQSFVEPVIPAFGLVADGAQIVSESVFVNIDGFEPNYFNSYSNVESVYTVTKTQGATAELSVPFLGKAIDATNIDVSVNGEPAVCEIRYGDSYFLTDKTPDPREILSGVISPNLSDVPDGTLYTFMPIKDVLNVEMRLAVGQHIIYDATNDLSSSQSSEVFNLHLNNVVSGQPYYFFVVSGDFSEPPVSDAEYTMQTLSCKDYIDGFFDVYGTEFSELYPNVHREFFYAEMQRILNGGSHCKSYEFFFDRLSGLRGNACCISLPDAEGTFTVAVKQKAHVQINNRFNPAIYMVKYLPTGEHTTDYELRLNGDYSYLLESNMTFDKEREQFYTCHSQSSDEISYFIFSASELPTDLYAEEIPPDNTRTVVLAVCITVGVIAVIVLIFNVIQVNIKRRHS